MFEFLGQQFIQYAIIAGFLISIATGVIGTLVVVMRKVFIAGGIAHSAYGGVGIAYYLGISPIIGGLVFSALAGLIMGALEKRTKQRADTVIGIIWAVGMAIGVVFIDITKGYAVDLMSFLFGSIIAISLSDILLMVVVNCIILATVGFLYKDLLAYAFDPEFATLMNRRNRFLSYIFLILTALTVIIMIRLVGLILVIALLTIPATIAERMTKKLKTMMMASVVISAILIILGLMISYFANISAGATIILVAAMAYGVTLLVSVPRKQRVAIKK